MRLSRRRSRGLSTMEVMIGSVLSLVVASTMYAFLHAQQRAFMASSAYAESQSVTRTVIDILSRELRMATYNPAGTALAASGPCCPGWSQGIVDARSDRVQFRQDLNGDGDVTDTNEDLTYTLSSGEIRRTDGAGSPQVLVSNVPTGGLVFRYYDGSTPPNELVPSGTPSQLTSCQRDCVAKVRISVHAEVTSPTSGTPHVLESEATSEVAIRNRSLTNF
jgi:Tfp pilus assembly protein PilW